MARWSSKVITPPADTPVDLSEVKRHLSLFHDEDDDVLLSTVIPAATDRAQLETDRQLITATRRVTFAKFPSDGVICLPFPPLQGVTSLEHRDSDGVWQTVAASDYEVITDTEPGLLLLKQGKSWPGGATGRPASVRLDFTCGYGATKAAVPHLLRQGVLIVCKHLYDQRDEIVNGTIVAKIPNTASDIFNQFRPGDEFVAYA